LVKRFKGGKRLGALALAICTMAFIVQLAAPASAVTPPSSLRQFYPAHEEGGATNQLNQDSTGNARFDVLSDKNDGVDTAAHLTAVADPLASQVNWYHCDVGTSQPDPSCSSLGSDTSGVLAPAGVGDGADEAYDINVDIPPALDKQVRAVDAEACNGAPDSTFSNCAQDVVDNVTFDDGVTGAEAPTTAGEITYPTHGGSVSNNGFTATGSTSPELDGVVFGIECGDDADNSGTDIDTNDYATDTTPDTTTATAKTWSKSMVVCADDEMALTLSDTDDGSASSGVVADCETGGNNACAMDRHYIASVTPVPTTAVITLPDQATSAHPDGTCAEPINTGSDVADNNEEVEGCLFDQDGNNVTNDFDSAFQASPVDTKASLDPNSGFNSGDGDENDTNGDKFNEQVDLDPGNAGSAADEFFYAVNANTYTLTYCFDSNNDAEDTPSASQSATPCANETVKADATKTITAAPQNHDHLRFAEDVVTDASCHTGANNKTTAASNSVNLTQCVRDAFENGVANAPVQWFITSGPGNFLSTEQSTDAGGYADATLGNGVGGTQTTVKSCTKDPKTGFFDICSDFLAINWTAPTPPAKSRTTLTMAKDVRPHNVLFFGELRKGGAANHHAAAATCRVAFQLIRFFRGHKLVATTHTNAGGDWKVKRHKAKVLHAFHARYPGNSRCRADTSPIRKAKAK